VSGEASRIEVVKLLLFASSGEAINLGFCGDAVVPYFSGPSVIKYVNVWRVGAFIWLL